MAELWIFCIKLSWEMVEEGPDTRPIADLQSVPRLIIISARAADGD